MPYIMAKDDNQHERCPTPSTGNANLGSIWQCDVCARIYVLRANTSNNKPSLYWSRITPKQAAKLIKKYQRRTGPVSRDMGPC